jgi:hypothetical protein
VILNTRLPSGAKHIEHLELDTSLDGGKDHLLGLEIWSYTRTCVFTFLQCDAAMGTGATPAENESHRRKAMQ